MKDLVVHLTGSAEDDVRLAFAEAVATQFDAHLIGVHLHVLPEILAISEPGSVYVQTLLEDSEAEGERGYQSLVPRFAALKISHELRRLHGLTAQVSVDLTRIARDVDLFVGTRPYGEAGDAYRIEEAVLFGSGRGSLLLPPGGIPNHQFETIVIAWNGSREASRAVAEAMPFLLRAANVLVAQVVDPGQSTTDVELGSIGLMEHLGRYGIKAQRAEIAYSSHTGEQIEELAHQKGATLIVTGAYGHSRILEWALGGVTRHLLRHSTLPLLMAH